MNSTTSMNRFSCLAICGLALLQTLVAGINVPYYFQPAPFTRRDLSVTKVQRELGPLLSNTSAIFGPSDARYDNATERWDAFLTPDVEIVARVGQESDVSIIVKYCNANSIDFMAVNRGHAITSTISSFKGLQIDLGLLQAIDIQLDAKSAWLQGGTYGGLVVDYLWDKGYVATTGSCACIGLMGPGLGGGHGRYQGLYGLVSDNIISLNVVLADASAITVNSTSNPDLFWAMRGAGHNFGIVTSFQLQIHPRLVDTWHYHNYVWTQDKLEQVFEALNAFHGNGTTPVLMGSNAGQFAIVPNISETEAMLIWGFGYAGPAADAEKLLEPFNAISAVSEESGDVPFPEIAHLQGTGLEDATCQDGSSYAGSTLYSLVYNVTAERQIYNLFNEKIALYPEFAAGASFLHEGYSDQAVVAVDPASSAFPHRDEHHLLYFLLAMDKGSYSTDAAWQWAAEVRDIWAAGQPTRLPATYVNYALGSESLESIYGDEPWRLERLRSLKAKYDPDNRFRYYNPFVL
ncbi:FAD-linked oxidoreductase azaG [Lachnellula arida]|uniref:FAD-linked oxidoreductase azaG n=1 Tax=Lachnellula arida TaxID=1316785 RepID=A0A8T9BBG1_9HELO|nr:FAD-linked oxidoreductase azaG [Lachnellula arida]